MPYDIQDIQLAPAGRPKIAWSQQQMPVLAQIRRFFEEEMPLRDFKVAACLHVTSETACLVSLLKAGGASVALCAANPLSTQDDVAAALVEDEKIAVYARRGEDNATYYNHIDQLLDTRPHLIVDNGADLISEVHKNRSDQVHDTLGAIEETTTGLARVNSMIRTGVLKFPVVAINQARSKYLFDNRYGTGQSTLDSIMRATNMLLAGKVVVVCGYGWCGKGIAKRAQGMGAIVVVVEINPINALEAAMEGHLVRPMLKAAKMGDLFITVTGDLNVIRREHFAKMKDGAVLCNAGHFNSEIDISTLEQIAKNKQNVRTFVDAYTLEDGRVLTLLAEGRLVNLACGEGHPASVMDMSFANQALALAHLAQHHRSLSPRLYPVPDEIDEQVAQLKLQAMGIEIDQRTQEQLDYQISWELGT